MLQLLPLDSAGGLRPQIPWSVAYPMGGFRGSNLPSEGPRTSGISMQGEGLGVQTFLVKDVNKIFRQNDSQLVLLSVTNFIGLFLNARNARNVLFFTSKCTKMHLVVGLRPDPLGEPYSAF